MTKPKEVYKCEVCGIVVEAIEGGAGEPVCCGQPMTLLEAKTEDASNEKHVPYIERTAEGVEVRVGKETAHPMETKHFIQWIELTAGDVVMYKRLSPDDEPAAIFPAVDGELSARELCNVHGLWTS
jgi:superoxide reductase